MKVGVITYLYPGDDDPGAGRFVQRQVDAVRRRGIDVEVLRLPPVSRAGYFMPRRWVTRWARSRNLDVLHIHGGLALGAARGVGTLRRVVTIHGSEAMTTMGRIFLRLHLRRRDTIVVVAEHLRRAMPALGRAHVIPCGVDIRLFSASRPRGPLEGRVVKIAFPSSPTRPEKNHPLFTAVCAELRARGWRLRVTNLHGLPDTELARVLGGLDIVLYTSTREGSPVLSKEAMCCGARLAATRVGDLETQVEGMRGCGTAQAIPGALAALVERCLSEPGPDPQEAARRFSLDREATALARIYLGRGW